MQPTYTHAATLQHKIPHDSLIHTVCIKILFAASPVQTDVSAPVQAAERLCGTEERGRDLLHERGVSAAVHAALHPCAGAGRQGGPPRRAQGLCVLPVPGLPFSTGHHKESINV